MTRGNQREKDRERAAARSAKLKKKEGRAAPKVGGKNADADALAAKIAAKKAMKEAGTLKTKDKGSKQNASKKAQNLVNPHTGKKDPKYTEKMRKKGAK